MYRTPYLVFKSARLESEWSGGGTQKGVGLHPALYVVVLAAAHWHYRTLGKPAELTCLLRTPEEQKAIYPDRRDFRSPHEFGRAADLRTLGLSPETSRLWEEWLNLTFSYRGKAGARTALVHEVHGLGEHLHLQIGPQEAAPKMPESFVLHSVT
ncbi:MAG: hypothetical protein A3F83_13210 [Candidatus Glassbacteria bacterium RIFCSPLOWO2_12_FULL_58_11]|uniref:Peptidase M15A C-terminal domain-containing protein n=1 Tax=Candidatus Glassbacteria bacterium RIFCSPLOWO2_12_FULL_58_11 TaxID=1817867 RepID=A0A1F5YZ31_9BACT|nr:MAG: hypothetical protein A3F83_13210 [Candidatus Glassbacteria bacterium RIFCSPLOWO2_12_FULL_58_11]